MNEKILLLHTPEMAKVQPGNLELHICHMPMGMFFLAGELKKKNYDVSLLHLGVEVLQDGNFDIVKYVTEKQFAIVGLSLHWHYQTRDVLLVAELIKKASPSTFILLGGYTASSIAEEIMLNCPWVDGIIKGEGEAPMVALADEILRADEKELTKVPNLYWRNADKKIICNDAIWVAGTEELNKYDAIIGLECLKSADLYLRSPIDLICENYQLYLEQPSFDICLGRGCLGNCAWCGGGFNAVKKISGRKCVSLRSPQVVVNEISKLVGDLRIEKIYTCYDPFPNNPEQMLEILKMLGAEMPKKVVWDYECFGLPTEEFINEFKSNLSDDSCIILSPDIADENKRFSYKAFAYTDLEFFSCLDLLCDKKIKVQIYLAKLPNDNKEDEQKRKELVEKMVKYENIVAVFEQELGGFEPFAPWVLEPSKYGIDIPRCDLSYYKNNIMHSI